MRADKGHPEVPSQANQRPRLSESERRILLKLAREALEDAVNGRSLKKIDLKDFPASLREKRASFVTLTKQGFLRGCIGALEPYLPLVEDVREHSVAAGLQDYRFAPVEPQELGEIEIEISCLTVPQVLDYESPAHLLEQLRVGIDGVILMDGAHRATFLPQVWEKLPDKNQFLGQLCQKMGASQDLWWRKKLKVLIYQVEEFSETDFSGKIR